MDKSFFMSGDTVFHKQFGNGVVINIVDDNYINVKFKRLFTFRTINKEKLINMSVHLGLL